MKLAISLAAGLVAACSLCAFQNASAALSERPIAITGATVIDGNGGAPEPNATVLIEGNRIVAVGPARIIAVPKGARVIEGKGRWVIPGLIDTNVHLSYPDGVDDIPERQALDMLRLLKQLTTLDQRQRDLAVRFSVEGVPTVSLDLAAGRERLQKDLDAYLERTREQREARQAGMLMHIRRNAQLHLRNGVTTVFDTDGYLRPLLQVRDEIASGKTAGPRLLVAGNIVGWGAGASLTNGGPMFYDPDVPSNSIGARLNGVGEDLVDLPLPELEQRIEQYLALGPDMIKYGGTIHPNIEPALPVFSLRQQQVIVDVAHRHGKPVSTHCLGAEAMRTCILAGVDMFHHAQHLTPPERPLPDELLELMKAHKTICSNGGKRLFDAGCTITTETDLPGSLGNGEGLAHVLAWLAEQGMTPLEVITAATRNGALAAKLLHEIGTIERGKRADLVVLDADPLLDLLNVKRIHAVIRDGVLFERADLDQFK